MSFVGDLFHSIGSLFSGGGSNNTTIEPPSTPKPAAAQQTPASQKPNDTAGTTPSFLAAAALPNYGSQLGAVQSNVGGKTLLGQ